MWKIGIMMSILAMTGVAQAQETTCTDQAIAQTRTKIREHYAKQGIEASLPYIQTVDLSGVTSNGPFFKGSEYESVEYTTFTIVGTLALKGQGKFMDYGFYVRLNPRTCDVLKVALLRTGKSPFLAVTGAQIVPQQLGGGLVRQQISVGEIETPTDGSPKLGYTYAGQGEESVPVVERASVLEYLQKRTEQLIRKY